MDFQVSIFSIILILAFYLPGYYFRRFYYSDFSTKQLGSGEWYDRFFKSIFYGTVLQLIILKILRENFRINYDSVSAPINQIFRKIWEGKLPDLDYSNFSNAVSYLILSAILSCLAGYLFRRFIRFTKIDVQYTSFRFANIWHYYFRGDIVKIKDFKSLRKKGKWISTRADILVDFVKDEKNVLYSGIISQYDLSPKSDKLERIYLTSAARYSSAAKGFKKIPGDILILDCNRIININLSYDFILSDKKKKSKIFFQILSGILILSPLILIRYFFYGYLGLFRIIGGVLEILGAMLFIATLFSIVSDTNEDFKKNYPKNGKSWLIIITIISIISFLIAFLFTLKVL